MRQPLRVLIVEDNRDDAELMVQELRREGFAPDYHRAETEAEYLAGLSADLDVILVDYALPNFNAMDALQLLKDRGLVVPVIIVSGTIHEEMAINAMRQGAADYLLKDRLARLGAAVRQAMEQAKLRRERRQALQNLRLFRSLVDQSDDTFEVIDPATARFLDVSQKGCTELGYHHSEYCTRRVFDLDLSLTEGDWAPLVERIRTTGTLNREGRYRRKNGTSIPVEVNARWVALDRHYIVAVVRNITARKHVEDVLRESERRFREMLENIDLIAITLDMNGTVTFCNDSLLRITGWQREEVIGRNWFAQFTPGNPEVKSLFLSTAETTPFPAHYENPIRTRDGELREISWNNTALRGSAGNIIGMASIGIDITERKRAENALRESEGRFRSFMKHSPIAGWIVDVQGHFRFVSPGYYRMFKVNVEDLTGCRIIDIFPPEIAAAYLANNDRALHERKAVEAVEKAVRPDNSIGDFMVVKFPMDGPDGSTLLGGIALDITEHKKLEQQILRTQRMESIGTMAGGIAHDLNNSLSPILMSIDLLMLKCPDPQSQELLALIRSGAERGANMVKQLLSFGRGLEGQRMEVQLRSLVHDIEKIVCDTFPKDITVTTRIPDDVGTVIGDPTQLHQVLLNLCLNARDAMPNGGRLHLTAENTFVDEQYAALAPDAQPGPYVFLSVADSGMGISTENIAKIFDPFFTTKEFGKGTGLGLSSSLGIVKSHGGFIRVDSKPGEGTTFQVGLPARTGADSLATTNAHPTTSSAEPDLPRGQGQTILVVDDEHTVREITKQTLEAFGYRALTATDGADAVRVYAAHREEIAGVVMDLSMPVMDGPATMHVLRRMNSNLPIIAASGRPTQSHLEQLGNLGIKTVLSKPFTAQQLLKALRDSLLASGG